MGQESDLAGAGSIINQITPSVITSLDLAINFFPNPHNSADMQHLMTTLIRVASASAILKRHDGAHKINTIYIDYGVVSSSGS